MGSPMLNTALKAARAACTLLNRAALKAAEPLEGRPTKLSKAVTIVVPVRFELH